MTEGPKTKENEPRRINRQAPDRNPVSGGTVPPPTMPLATKNSPKPSIAPADASAEGDWDTMEEQLAAWGRQLDKLRARTNLAGSELLQDLEHRYDEVTKQAEILRQDAEKQAREAQELANKQADILTEDAQARLKSMQNSFKQSSEKAKENLSELAEKAAVRSEAATETVKETSEKLWLGAQEVGEGFSRAWDELRSAFQNASQKMQDEDDAPDRPKKS